MRMKLGRLASMPLWRQYASRSPRMLLTVALSKKGYVAMSDTYAHVLENKDILVFDLVVARCWDGAVRRPAGLSSLFKNVQTGRRRIQDVWTVLTEQQCYPVCREGEYPCKCRVVYKRECGVFPAPGLSCHCGQSGYTRKV